MTTIPPSYRVRHSEWVSRVWFVAMSIHVITVDTGLGAAHSGRREHLIDCMRLHPPDWELMFSNDGLHSRATHALRAKHLDDISTTAVIAPNIVINMRTHALYASNFMSFGSGGWRNKLICHLLDSFGLARRSLPWIHLSSWRPFA